MYSSLHGNTTYLTVCILHYMEHNLLKRMHSTLHGSTTYLAVCILHYMAAQLTWPYAFHISWQHNLSDRMHSTLHGSTTYLTVWIPHFMAAQLTSWKTRPNSYTIYSVFTKSWQIFATDGCHQFIRTRNQRTVSSSTIIQYLLSSLAVCNYISWSDIHVFESTTKRTWTKLYFYSYYERAIANNKIAWMHGIVF